MHEPFIVLSKFDGGNEKRSLVIATSIEDAVQLWRSKNQTERRKIASVNEFHVDDLVMPEDVV